MEDSYVSQRADSNKEDKSMGTWKKQRGVSLDVHSLQFRINILVLFIVLTLIIFLVCNNGYAITVIRNNAYDTNAELMNMYMNQIDNSLETMEDYWGGQQLSSDFIALQSSAEKNTNFYTSQYRMKQDMSGVIQSYSYIDCMFMYCAKTDGYFDAYKNNISESERRHIRTMILAAVKQADEKGAVNSQWEPMKISGEWYFFRTFRYKNVYMGGCVSVSRIVNTIQSDGLSTMDYLTFFENDGTELGNQLSDFDETISVSSVPQKYIKKIGRYNYLVISQPSSRGNYSMVTLIKDNGILEGLGALQKIIIVLSLFIMVFYIVFVSLSRKWIIKPVQRLCGAMNQLKHGNWDIRLKIHDNCTEFKLVNDTFNDMIENIQSLKIDVYEQKMQRQKAELQYREAEISYQKAELQYMKLQVNPHFYINCLNIIHNLTIMNKPDLVQEMTTYLGNHLRYTMEGTTVDSLQKELDYVRNYVHIQELRFADSLKAWVEVEPLVENVMVPPLVLQTFVENTVKYQVVAGERTEIYIVATWCERPEDHRIRIEIWDTGDGFSQKVLDCLNEGRKIMDEKGEHYGIRNVITRLHLIYGGREHVEFKNHYETGGAYIILELPDDGGQT